MKLYTKKMTYSLLATGLLACAPVDAYTYLPRTRINCHKMCQGYFVHAANDKNLTGAIKQTDISYKLGGSRGKTQCKCTYKGDLDIEKNKTFNMQDARESGEQKELKKVSNQASISKSCDPNKEMCLI